jgi:2-iminobutanoate/2-iminopropanoate deaminase
MPWSRLRLLGISSRVSVKTEAVLTYKTEQTHRVLKNVTAVLEAAGSGLERVVKTTVYLKNFDDFQAMNDVHMQYFSKDFPARATCEVARLPKDALVEIEAIGYIE